METAINFSVAVFGLIMRKKWLRLLVLLMVLSGAVFWARDLAWKKQEVTFRVAMRWWMDDIEYVNVGAADSPQHRVFGGFWDAKEFLTVLDDLHLMRARSPVPDMDEKIPMLVIGFPSGVSAQEESGFYLDLEDDRGWIKLPNQNSSEHWENFEFTPETCRALKKRIFALREKDGELFASPRANS